MISLRNISGVCLLCALPVVAAPAPSAVEVARRLVEGAREVDRVLRTVSDRETGVAAAAELRKRMEQLRSEAEQLGRLPMDKAEDLRALEQLMRDLTHVTQGYMPVVQRLVEVNAYGAEELISLFTFYKMSAAAGNAAGESPLVRAYSGWCESIDDMLYLLRRAQDAATAAAIVSDLSAVVGRVERLAEQTEALQQGLSPQQLESERVPMSRFQSLRAEVRAELRRLLAAQSYGVPGLQELLARCSRACRC